MSYIHRFKHLFIKELKQERLWLIIGLPIVTGLVLMLFILSYYWKAECLGFSILLLIGLPVCAFCNIVHSHTSEWKSHTAQYLFSLPIRGWHIALSKFAVQSLFLITSSLIVFGAIYFIGKIRFHTTLGLNPAEIIKIWIIYIALIVPLFPFFVFPYVIAKCFVRLQTLIAGIVSIVLFFGVFPYVIPLGSKVFGFLPEAYIIEMPTQVYHRAPTFFPNMAMFILLNAILFAGICLMLDRWTEI